MKTDTLLHTPILHELLRIADTEWVLGHWYIKVMRNGRSLPDFNALAGMAQDCLGHTRAWFGLLEDQFLPEATALEFDRGPHQVFSLDALDRPPVGWPDLIATTWLAEQSVVALLRQQERSDHADIANLATRCLAESRFHNIYIQGWYQHADADTMAQVRQALTVRAPLALRWLRGDNSSNPAGQVAHDTLRQALTQEFGLSDIPTAAPQRGDPNDVRSAGPLPATLWEFMVPTNEQAVLCRRPLQINLQDGIRFM